MFVRIANGKFDHAFFNMEFFKIWLIGFNDTIYARFGIYASPFHSFCLGSYYDYSKFSVETNRFGLDRANEFSISATYNIVKTSPSKPQNISSLFVIFIINRFLIVYNSQKFLIQQYLDPTQNRQKWWLP